MTLRCLLNRLSHHYMHQNRKKYCKRCQLFLLQPFFTFRSHIDSHQKNNTIKLSRLSWNRNKNWVYELFFFYCLEVSHFPKSIHYILFELNFRTIHQFLRPSVTFSWRKDNNEKSKQSVKQIQLVAYAIIRDFD